MKDKEFMNQKASEMTTSELAEAIKIKQEENKLIGFDCGNYIAGEPTYKVGDEVFVESHTEPGSCDLIGKEATIYEICGKQIYLSDGGYKHGKGLCEPDLKPKKEELLNPMHFCMNDCGTYLGHRGFCRKKCHDKWYDTQYSWDELKEKKTLSDKAVLEYAKQGSVIETCGRAYREKDVKASLKDFLDWFDGNTTDGKLMMNPIDVEDKTKEIFGEDLI